jgi:hypothetical protein
VIHRRGLRLGSDLSLVCCDDVPLSRFHQPPIATVMRDPNCCSGNSRRRVPSNPYACPPGSSRGRAAGRVRRRLRRRPQRRLPVHVVGLRQVRPTSCKDDQGDAPARVLPHTRESAAEKKGIQRSTSLISSIAGPM